MPGICAPPTRQVDCAVSDIASAERPLYPWRSATISWLPVCVRAAITAVSFASVPEFVKYEVCKAPGASAASFSASATWFWCG